MGYQQVFFALRPINAKDREIIFRSVRIMKRLCFLILVMGSILCNGQNAGDHRTAISGTWTDPASWEVYNGNTWMPAMGYPDNMDSAITVRSGHEIILNTTNIFSGDLTVEPGGKLFANSAGVYRYLVAFGDIICDGMIGNDTLVDGICLEAEGDTVMITGTGNCKFRRIRKDAGTNIITRLIFDMPVEIHYDGSGYGLYNNQTGTHLDIYINPEASLVMHGKINLLRSHLTLRSSALSTGQLVCPEVVNSVGINTVVEQYIEKDNHWHFLSSPVVDQVIAYYFVPDPPGNTSDFYKWGEDLPEGQAWVNIKDSSGGIDPAFEYEFVEGRGYLIAYAPSNTGPEVRQFHGTMLDGDQSLPVTLSNNTWNLVGNPYTCGLDWSSAGVDRSLATGSAMYIWDQEMYSGAGGYRTHNGVVGVPEGTGPVVPPMNGFFVSALGSGSIDIDISEDGPLVVSSQKFFKSDFLSCAFLRVAVVQGVVEDETVVCFGAGFDDGFEAAEDAVKLFRSHPGIPELYSIADLQELVINNSSGNFPDIQLGYVYSDEGDLVLSFSGFESIDPSVEIWLEDRYENRAVPVRKISKYPFTTLGGPVDDRFIIKFRKTKPVESEERESASQAITFSNGLLHINGYREVPGLLTMCDASGKTVFINELQGGGPVRFLVDPSPGIYFVNLYLNGTKYTAKVFINR